MSCFLTFPFLDVLPLQSPMQTSIRMPCPLTQLVAAIARVQYFCGAGVIQDRNVSLKVQQANGVLLSLLEKYHRNGLQTISEAKERHPEFVSSWHSLNHRWESFNRESGGGKTCGKSQVYQGFPPSSCVRKRALQVGQAFGV